MARTVPGFALSRQSIFPAEDAEWYSNLTRAKLRALGVDIADTDNISDDGLLYNEGDRIHIVKKNEDNGELLLLPGNVPYIHHCVGINHNAVPVLYEACKYIDL